MRVKTPTIMISQGFLMNLDRLANLRQIQNRVLLIRGMIQQVESHFVEVVQSGSLSNKERLPNIQMEKELRAEIYDLKGIVMDSQVRARIQAAEELKRLEGDLIKKKFDDDKDDFIKSVPSKKKDFDKKD